MKTFLAQNKFNSDVHVPETSGSAATIACPQPRAVAAFLSPGDIDENLHDLQSATPVRSVPPRRDGGGGRSLGEMQDVRETKKTRKAHGSAGEDTRPAESPGAQSTSACREDWKNSETGPLRNVSRVDAKKCSRRPSQGLLETASSDMGLSQLSWSGTLNMETIGLADLSVSDGVGAKPILAFMPSEAATVSGREPVAATNPVAKATKGKAGMAEVTGLVRRSTAGTGLRVGEAGAVQPATSEIMDVTGRRDVHLSHNKITQAVEIQSSCGSTTRPCQPGTRFETIGTCAGNPLTEQGDPSPQDFNPALPVSSEPSLPAVAPSAQVAAGFLQIQNSCVGVGGHANDTTGSHGFQVRIDPGVQDHIHDLEQLIGVAGKRRRRPLALPRFAPDEDAIEAAMHDPNAPRLLAGDPVWADASPLFLSDVR